MNLVIFNLVWATKTTNVYIAKIEFIINYMSIFDNELNNQLKTKLVFGGGT